MEKANILKGLQCCADEDKNCDGCPYQPVGMCTCKLAKDAAALIKANEIPKPKYPCAIIFTKRDTMLPYLTHKVQDMRPPVSETHAQRIREYYAREREIQLIALFRFEGRKCLCKIKCPVNPLPIKGEFEVVSQAVLTDFLKANGWQFKERMNMRMFE